MRYAMNCCSAQPVRAARDALPKARARHPCLPLEHGGHRTRLALLERDAKVRAPELSPAEQRTSRSQSRRARLHVTDAAGDVVDAGSWAFSVAEDLGDGGDLRVRAGRDNPTGQRVRGRRGFRQLAKESRAARTWHAYDSDLRPFPAWRAERQLTPLPCPPTSYPLSRSSY
jgi:hypothetical protein